MKVPWKDPKVFTAFEWYFQYQKKSLVHFEKYQIWSFYRLLLKLGSLESMWYNLWWRQNTTLKALYISQAVKQFYGTEFEIFVGFGLVGSTENCQTEPIISYFWGQVFLSKRQLCSLIGSWFFDAVVLWSCCLWFREKEAIEVICHLLRSLRDWKSFQSCFCIQGVPHLHENH